MDELKDYLRGEGISTILQQYTEEEIFQQFKWNSTFQTEEVLTNDYLTLVESNEGPLIVNSQQYSIPSDYLIFQAWNVIKDSTTDEKGWKYNSTEHPTKRERNWEQLLILNIQFNQALLLFNDFHCKFRSLNQSFIHRSLQGKEYTFQFVLECQRLINGIYSPYNLKSTDPPSWSCVVSSSSTSASSTDFPVDPCSPSVAVSELTSITPEQFEIPLGWTYLHDFMYTSYPSRDICGWQYSTDFDSSTNPFTSSQTIVHTSTSTTTASSPPTKEVYPVRRRLWMRTLVRETEIQDCRNAFERYIQNHPRGTIYTSKIYRQSHFRKRWCFGTATLNDKSLHITLDDNYQQHISYDLKGCEVSVLTLKLQDSHLPTNSHVHNQPVKSHYLSSFPFLGCHYLPKRWYLFGLKYIVNKSHHHLFHGSNSSSTSTTSTNSTMTARPISPSNLPSSSPPQSSSGQHNGNTNVNVNTNNSTAPQPLQLSSSTTASSSSSQQNLNGSMQCILSALTRKERDIWISILFHQLLLVNLHHYPITTEFGVRLGPPLVIDSTYLSGKLWKKGEIVWKLRYFELRNNSRFTFFKNGLFLGEIDLKECCIQIPSDITFNYPFNIVNKTSNEVILHLATENSINRDHWVSALQFHISKLNGNKCDHHTSLHSSHQTTTATTAIAAVNNSEWFNTADLIERAQSPPTGTGGGVTGGEFDSTMMSTFVGFSHKISIDNDNNSNSSSSSRQVGGNSQGNGGNGGGSIGGGGWFYEPVMNLRMISYEIIQEYNHIESDDDDDQLIEENLIDSISSQESQESTSLYSFNKMTSKNQMRK